MLLSISNIAKRYGELIAIHPINLKIEGEIFGLIGNNGAGKSTLMKMIVGLLPPGKGKIHIGKLNVRKSPEEVKRHIGYLPESPLLFPRLTPEELLSFVSEVKGITDPKDEIDHWFQTFGLSDKRHALLNDLSYGMKKKIAMTAALIGKPALLILDEPFNGLDVATMETLSEIILQRYQEGATVVLSSHLMAYIDRLCHRIVILKKGKVIAEGSPEDLKTAANHDTFHETFLYFTRETALV